MTAPTVDPLSELQTDDIPIGVPNHKASSGERGEPKRARGLFDNAKRRTSGTAFEAKPKREAPPKLTPGVQKQLVGIYELIGASVRPFDEFAGDTIIEQAPKCAKSVYDLAQTNDNVRRLILSMTQTSAIGAVIFAHLPIVLAFMRHSKNDNVKGFAAGTMMALKFADAQTVGDLFPQNDEENTEDA